jgi:hypothetical protein
LQRKRQFQTAAKRRTFFDRKITSQGYSKQVSLSKLVPKTWTYVRLQVLEQTDKTVTLLITKLLGEELIAPDTKVNQGSRQDT